MREASVSTGEKGAASMKKPKTNATGPRPRTTRQASTRSRVTEKAAPRDSSIREHRSKSPKNTAPLREQSDLLQLAHDGIIVMDLNHAITFWNRGAEERYGWTASEALGQVAHVLLQTQFPQPLGEIHSQLLRSGRWEGELAHTRRDGTPIIVASRWALQRDAQGQPVAILEINNDITERKRAEHQIRQLNAELGQRVAERTAKLETANGQLEELNTQLEEEIAERQAEILARVQAEERARHLASFPELNPNPVIEVDASGKITFANPATQQVLEKLGIDPGNVNTLLPNGMDGILTDWDKKSTASHYQEIVVNNKVFGETITLTPQFKVARVYAYDITERKRAEEQILKLNQELERRAQELENANEEHGVSNEELRVANEDLERQIAVRERAEQALRHSEGRYHSLFENMLDGFAYCQLLYDDHGHPVDFVYLDVNAAFETLTGLKNVVGKKVTEVIPRIKEEHPELFEIYGRVAQTGQPERFVLEFKPLAIWLSLSVYSPERGYFMAVFENITARKRAEESLQAAMHRIQKLNEDLEQRAGELEVANEDLERLATSLALDLRSPLVSLQSVSRLIAQDYGAELPPQAQRLFQLIDANAEEMDQLTQGLLQMMRVTRQTLRKQELNPEEIVRAALTELSPECEGRQVEFTVGHLPSCRADPLLLKQVWVNLLSNALKFTRPRDQARIEIGARPEGNGIVYFVKDNGVGFDMSYAGTIFRAFQRYHHAEEWGGTGVGLAIVESIVRRHGGRVWAEGVVKEGATFYFALG